MRGILACGLGLIVGYVALQKGSADKLTAASGTFSAGLHRVLSGEVAGVPDKAKANPRPAIGSDPRTSPGPKAETPPPGTPPGTPPYVWNLTWPGSPGTLSA